MKTHLFTGFAKVRKRKDTLSDTEIKAINTLVDDMNDCLEDVYREAIFVSDINVSNLKYYYDESSNKIKLSVNVTHKTNDEVFKNENIKGAFNDFLQVLSNELNDMFTNENSEIGEAVQLMLKNIKNN